MKSILLLCALTFPTFVMAASATLKPTSELAFTIENSSGVKIISLDLQPKFSCWTTQSQGFAGAYTDSNDAKTLFQINTVANGDTFQSTVQHMNTVKVVAPKKEKIFNHQTCGVMLYLVAQTESEGAIHFSGSLIDVKSKKKHMDLTRAFEKETVGTYELKKVYSGTAYDPETNGRMPVCKVVLFKEVNGKLKEIGGSYNHYIEHCDGTN